ncbi:hypothetical protein Ndes2526B_g04312 [Nannochloris sp. 'desiccata']|nr:hypothetical protein KSW81_000923 [Chlorella desiccata (nom. nud.)]KAH7620397.1 putative Succinate dehydrogenase [ubiquinone] cytochrome b small subunit, mitochondrial [Chlorella desiccata (nom. nud.)]
MNKVLYADAAGTAIQRYYGKSHIALAGLIPATLLSPSDSIPAKIADVGIAAIVPFHAHVGLNVVVADYVPKMMQVPARIGVLGLSSAMFLGLMKLSLGGPGIGGALKEIWKSPAEAAQKS